MPELIPFPERSARLAPELSTEELKNAQETRHLIDERFEIWARYSHHPALTVGGIARHIRLQTTSSPEDILKAAEREQAASMPNVAQLHPKNEDENPTLLHDQEVLVSIAADDSLHEIPIRNDEIHAKFDEVISLLHEPRATDDQRIALASLYRMYVQREIISGQLHETTVETQHLETVLEAIKTYIKPSGTPNSP